MFKRHLFTRVLEPQSKRRTALPARFTALYRLFLRATSAAVLHHAIAMRTMRILYRPTFEAAAGAVKRLEMLQNSERMGGGEKAEGTKEEQSGEEGPSGGSDTKPEDISKEIENLKSWLKAFDERSELIPFFNSVLLFPSSLYILSVNNTLSFLLTSSQSRGLSNDVVKRLVHLAQTNYHWTSERLIGHTRVWNPKLDPKSPEYSTLPPSMYASNVVKVRERREKKAEFDAKCWGALGEVIRMAEARDGLSLGRIRFKLRRFNNKKFY